MKKVKILIVENQPRIQHYISVLLHEMGYEVSVVVEDIDRILSKIKMRKPDLILFSIAIKGSDKSLKTANKVIKRYNLPVIYLTNLQYYRLNDLHEILQNEVCINYAFTKKELRRSIVNAFDKVAARPYNTSDRQGKVIPDSNNISYSCFMGNCILLKREAAFRKICLGEVIWIEDLGQKCKVKIDDIDFFIEMGIDEIIDYLDTYIFLQVHEKFIINAKRLSAFKSEVIMMDDGKFIKIGSEYKNVFRDVLQFW